MSTAHVPAAASPATIGRRVGAFAIDVGISTLITVVAAVVASLIAGGVVSTQSVGALLAAVTVVYAIVSVVALAWGLVYTAMQGGRGSIGQRMLGLRLTDASTGAAIGFWRALVRNIVWVLAGSIVVGYFTPLFDSGGRRQGWHDMAARAVVGDVRMTDAAAHDASWAEVDRPAASDDPAASGVPAAPVSPTPTVATVFAAPPSFPAPPTEFRVAPVGTRAPSTGQDAAPGRAAPIAAPQAEARHADALISFVPGVTGGAPTSNALDAPAPAPVAPAPAPVAPAPEQPAEALDATRAVAPRARAIVALTWDDGTRSAVYGRTLFGRNPAPDDGATAIAVRDETLSLSKTHFEVGGDASGVWIVDRHSTNGTVLLREGIRRALSAGEPTPLAVGDRLEFGDRSVTVGDSA